MKSSTSSEHAITEVTSVVSHQLKTPLSGIKSSLEVLLSNDLGALNKEQSEYVSLALESVEKMIALVKNLLDVSRIDQGRLQLEPRLTDFGLLIKDLLAEATPLAQAKNTEITFSIDESVPKLMIDPLKIQQVVSNLIYNAIRYSRGKGSIQVHVSLQDGAVLFACHDNGVGISGEDEKKIFTKYYRSPRVVALAPDGSGLGLYIAKAIIEASGGTIWFESTVDKGTTFYFTIPLQ